MATDQATHTESFHTRRWTGSAQTDPEPICFSGTAETKALIDALVKLEFEKVAGRVSEQGKMGFAHGVKLILTVSDQILLKEQIFFLGCVLSVYLSQYAEVNIFTQLEVKLKSTGKRFYQWPSLTGDKVLL